MPTLNPSFEELVRDGLPWFDPVDLQGLPNTQGKLYYSSPAPGRMALCGLHFNHDTNPDLNLFVLNLTDTSDAPVWTPEGVPASAVLTTPTQANPTAWFVLPYIVEQGTRVQIKLINNDFTGLNTNARITLVCLRLPAKG